MDSADVDAINLALLVLRCGLGAVMLAHGINHIFGGGKIAGTARWFESLGMKPGKLHAWLASLTELAAGAALVLGLLTPFAAGALIGIVVVAFITNHLHAGFFVFARPTEGWEYLMNLAAALFAIGIIGPGEWSLDDAIDYAPSPTTAMWITLVIGVGGAAALLAVFWRPPAKDPASN
jgi:putative oxidoreductase